MADEREMALKIHIDSDDSFWVRFDEVENQDVVWGRNIPSGIRLKNGAPNCDTAECLVDRFNCYAETHKLNERLGILVHGRFDYEINSDGSTVTNISDNRAEIIWLNKQWSGKLVTAWNEQLKLAANVAA